MKDKKRLLSVFLLAVLGGVAISISGILFLSVENRVVGSILFTVGLYSICVHGLNLYTGKVGYLVNEPLLFCLDLLVIWVGNLVGTLLSGFAVHATRIADISEKAVQKCEVKVNDSLFSLFLLAVFCGILMYVAVEGYRLAKNPLILFMGVSAFILCGFEHSVADMFYFSVAQMWSVRSFLCIIVITLGNSVGAVLIPLAKKQAEISH